MTFGDFLTDWAPKRRGRNAQAELSVIENFLQCQEREWLTSIPLEELRPRHGERLVNELKATPSQTTGKPISEKYVSNIYGLFTAACRAARRLELILVDPCVLEKGTIRRKSRKGTRLPYEAAEFMTLASGPTGRVASEGAMFAKLVLYTGFREGEGCGRRFRDVVDDAEPLACILVDTQYDNRPLKTDSGRTGDHPRAVPIHPTLLAALKDWWEWGFEFVYQRQPTLDDFIVPRNKDGLPHTRSSAYKLWRAWCRETGVTNRSLHSTRHSFITWCRRGGADPADIEQTTHNAGASNKGIVDYYTHQDWEPLCNAVLALDVDIRRRLESRNVAHREPASRGLFTRHRLEEATRKLGQFLPMSSDA